VSHLYNRSRLSEYFVGTDRVASQQHPQNNCSTPIFSYTTALHSACQSSTFSDWATMSQPARLRSLYRNFLRELPPRPLSSTDTRSPLHQKLRQSFSNNASQDTTISQAEQFIHYLKAQRQYATLIERYNPGMNMEEEERIRLSARRVGMNLPQEYKKSPL
jgi:ATP synthase assembly factor FMC1, mitochondrial